MRAVLGKVKLTVKSQEDMLLLMLPQKTIAIDARFYAEAGPGRYVKNLLSHLEKIDKVNKYYVYLRKKGYAAYVPFNSNFVKILADVPWYSWKEQLLFLFILLKKHPDLFYVPHFNIPVLYPYKMITAIPDIIMHTYSTERGTTQPKIYFLLKKKIYAFVVGWALFRSSKVIVPTKDVFDDMTGFYKFVDKSKFVIAPEGVDADLEIQTSDDEAVLKKLNISEPYLLYISSMYEHKNVPNLLKAFAILIDKYNYNGNLVLVGKNDKFSQNIYELARSMGLSKRIYMPGLSAYVSDMDSISLRKKADVYVFPSLKEGFSLTPLEAQSVGLACVISNISCHKEVFENSVMYFDPHSPEDIADKVNTVLKDSVIREDLIAKGYLQVKKYSWALTADITYRSFNAVLNG